MRFHYTEDTIIALSTPAGASLKAVLRISGPNALNCAGSVFSCNVAPVDCRGNGARWKPGINPNILKEIETFTSVNGLILIENEQASIPANLYIMKAPRSFTREDVVEIHTFGAPPIIDMILNKLLSGGQNRPIHGPNAVSQRQTGKARLAEPGEFTKRAFLNGRIDLAQAEAVMKLIRSKSDAEARAGMTLLNGNFSRVVHKIKDQLMDVCADVEASIDFSDQDISFISNNQIKEKLQNALEELNKLTGAEIKERRVYDQGINVAIYGKPNAGKSSLLNMLGPDIGSIVSDQPHTTRDLIKRKVKISNINFSFFDTAGIDQHHDNDNTRLLNANIKEQSMAKSNETIDYADLILFALDGSSHIDDINKQLYGKLTEKKKLIIVTKCDLPQKLDLGRFVTKEDRVSIINTSTVNGHGINELKKTLLEFAAKGSVEQAESYAVLNTRQTAVLNEAVNYITYALETTNADASLEFIALDLRNAMDSLGEITGNIVADDILDKIFSDFCIGK